MQKADALAAAYVALLLVIVLSGCGSGDPFVVDVDSIRFQTTQADFDRNPAGAGVLYSQQIVFTTTGNAAPPDTFELDGGVLPPGIQLLPDRVNPQGEFDPAGQLNGNARLVGYPRVQGDYSFRIRAISTGALGGLAQSGSGGGPNLTVSDEFVVSVGEGSINILTPEGNTSDPAVPAFPASIDFVNPANETAFFSWAFPIAGGSGSNLANIYIPRELELSVFDTTVVDGIHEVSFDTDESAVSGLDKFEVFFGDGGWFVLQAGNEKVQFGGFQSPRGPVDTIQEYEGGAGLDPDWFQRTTGSSGPDRNSRRYLGDTSFPDGDDSLGAESGAIQFSDYFDGLVMNPDGSVTREHDDRFEGTWDGWRPPDDADPGKPVLSRRKYPFTSDQYKNAFFSTFDSEVDLTPLKFRAIVEAIDTNGTISTKVDDTIIRKSYIVAVRIPDIVVDTVSLPGGIAGIEYTEIIAASGGVPPLEFGLEWVDSTLDLTTTDGDAITKEEFGLETKTISAGAGQFYGAARASGTAELSVFVTAAVLNPIQGEEDPSKYRPTGVNPGEWVGTNPLTGNTGIHKTFQVHFDPPSLPGLATTALPGGEDGKKYPVDPGLNEFVLDGVGGVPRLDLQTEQLQYQWDAYYICDASHDELEGKKDPDRKLPNDLAFDPAKGSISGTLYDRGFQVITFIQTDYYLGDISDPNLEKNRNTTETTLALSVSPDNALYLRGAPVKDGGEPSGLLEPEDQMAGALMCPLFTKAGVFAKRGSAAAVPLDDTDVPNTIDFIPILIANGGSDAHVNKSIPSISGFYPPESNSSPSWNYYYYDGAKTSWKHFQQECTWIQVPDDNHTRVYLWAETELASFTSGPVKGGFSSVRYQIHDDSGKRGVMVLQPLTGEYWFPVVLDNDDSDTYGSQFGAEFVLSTNANTPNYSLFGYVYSGFTRYYNYAQYSLQDREQRLIGLGSYLEPYDGGTSAGRATAGRTGTSVAVSADGVWCATVLVGGNEQKLLVWRNDGKEIPSRILSQSYVTALSGVDKNGDTINNTACIFNLGGEDFSGTTVATNARYLLPDSITFVRDGILFLQEKYLHMVFGLSLVDGHLSAVDINADRVPIGSNGTGTTVSSTYGQYIPDTDYLRGMKATIHFGAQFAFTGNAAEEGEEGPSKVAFIAGTNGKLNPFNDYSGSYTRLYNTPRWGYAMSGNRNKSLYFLETASGAALGEEGLHLDASTLKDLSGSKSTVYGDYLTPGRPGEELDFVKVSPDGRFVAVVRDLAQGYDYAYTYYGFAPTFATGNASSTGSYYMSTDDLLLFSTDGTDMDSRSGTQTCLYVGSASSSNGSTSTPSADGTYVSARAYLNAKGRRVCGLRFSPDSRSLIFTYAGDPVYWTKLYGYSYQAAVNANPSQYVLYGPLSAQISVRLDFRVEDTSGKQGDVPIAFTSSKDLPNFMTNQLATLSEDGINGFGDATPPFTASSSGQQQFWATFESPNGKFLYYISDQIKGRNYMVGINMSGEAVGGREPYEPFVTHQKSIGFEQFDCNSWPYECRFYAVPGGVEYAGGVPGSARDGSGLIFVIGSDSSAGASESTDLEVYAFDANSGGGLVCLTSNVTDGTENAINHLFVSADGNYLVGQRCKTATSSDGSRVKLNNLTDLFVVTNVHAAVFQGQAPNDFILSEQMSHGSTVAFIGSGTPTGAQALVFCSADPGSTPSNSVWAERTLKIVLLAEGSTPTTLDSTESHYVVLAGSRKVDDDWETAD